MCIILIMITIVFWYRYFNILITEYFFTGIANFSCENGLQHLMVFKSSKWLTSDKNINNPQINKKNHSYNMITSSDVSNKPICSGNHGL